MNKVILSSVFMVAAILLLYLVYDNKSGDRNYSLAIAGIAIASVVVLMYFIKSRRK